MSTRIVAPHPSSTKPADLPAHWEQSARHLMQEARELQAQADALFHAAGHLKTALERQAADAAPPVQP